MDGRFDEAVLIAVTIIYFLIGIFIGFLFGYYY